MAFKAAMPGILPFFQGGMWLNTIPQHMAEFDHRHNARFLTDGERTVITLKKRQTSDIQRPTSNLLTSQGEAT
jgi:hypothetical protein